MRDINSVVDDGPGHLAFTTTNHILLPYLIKVRQSLHHIISYRRTPLNEVGNGNFQDSNPAKGLHVFDNGTILSKTMGEPFVN
jgi:hypothetical protein